VYYLAKSEIDYPYGRSFVQQPLSWPYTCIGLVSVKLKDNVIVNGMGALIFRNFVLTCAQLVHDKIKN
jgi:hypothetical protein